MHIDPAGNEKGLVMLFNPTSEKVTEEITLPLYYTGLKDEAVIRQENSPAKTYSINRNYQAKVSVEIPANGLTWLLVK
jgi:hypothetical protein